MEGLTNEEIEMIVDWFDELGFYRGFDLFDTKDIDLKIKLAKYLKEISGKNV